MTSFNQELQCIDCIEVNDLMLLELVIQNHDSSRQTTFYCVRLDVRRGMVHCPFNVHQLIGKYGRPMECLAGGTSI